MKRIVKRIKTLNEHAAELTAAAGDLPRRVAEIREVMSATSGQLQSLKTDIQVSVSDLKSERPDDLVAALAEISGHAPVLSEAGFLLEGIDLELSPTQRVVVQLVRIGEAEPGEIESLIQKHHERSRLCAILKAMIRARDAAASIRIDGLDYHQLLIGIGPVPIIRIGWRATFAEEPPPRFASAPSWQPSGTQPLSGSTSFFGPPITQNSIFAADAATVSKASIPVVRATVPPPLPTVDEDPLARFKIMPNLRHTSSQ